MTLLQERAQIERNQSVAAVTGVELGVRAKAMRRNGNLAGAQALEESAAQIQDTADREALELKYKDQGFGDKSGAMADREIKARAAARKQDRDEETKQAGFARSEAGGKASADNLRTAAIEAEIRGHKDYADALREAAIRTEKAATFQQRVTDVMQKQGIGREKAEAQVRKADQQEQQQRGLEFQEQKKRRDLQKQRLQSENKARQMELGGNEEGAARERDKQTQKEREQELKEQGLDEKEAHKQSRKEMLDAQRKRQQQQQVEIRRPRAEDFMRGQKASSLHAIGGGGSVYGAGVHAGGDYLKRIDTIIKLLQATHEIEKNRGIHARLSA
jgi:hypothetical protein